MRRVDVVGSVDAAGVVDVVRRRGVGVAGAVDAVGSVDDAGVVDVVRQVAVAELGSRAQFREWEGISVVGALMLLRKLMLWEVLTLRAWLLSWDTLRMREALKLQAVPLVGHVVVVGMIGVAVLVDVMGRLMLWEEVSIAGRAGAAGRVDAMGG